MIWFCVLKKRFRFSSPCFFAVINTFTFQKDFFNELVYFFSISTIRFLYFLYSICFAVLETKFFLLPFLYGVYLFFWWIFEYLLLPNVWIEVFLTFYIAFLATHFVEKIANNHNDVFKAFLSIIKGDNWPIDILKCLTKIKVC